MHHTLINLWRRRGLLTGAGLVAFIVLAALVAPLLGTDPDAQDLYAILQPPSATHWFGTDAFGRDLLTRVVHGARISLVEIVAGVGLSCLAGVPIGLLAGTLGGRFDRTVMWVMDILFAFPGIILAILVVSILGNGLFDMLLAIATFSVPVYARLARNLAAGLRHASYVEAAIVLGAGRGRIIFDHILRNALGPIIVQSTLTAGTVVLAAAALSFLGLGAQPPSPEWGTMMSDGRNTIGADIYPSLFPGLALTLTVLGFNLLGDALHTLLDPRK